jgi:hypothetical protein
MPYRKTRLNRTEKAESMRYLHELQAEGVDVEIPSAWIDTPPDPDRLSLEQIHDGTAKIYDLPSNAVALVVPARLIILKSGMLITHVSVKIPWDDCPLELIEPWDDLVHGELIRGQHSLLPTSLNLWLKSPVQLRPRNVEGVILAEGWTSFPTDHQDSMPVTVELLIEDERHNKIKFDFEARVDRNLKRRYEQKQKRHFESRQASTGGLFEPREPSPFWWQNGSHVRKQAGASRPGGIVNGLASRAPQVRPSAASSNWNPPHPHASATIPETATPIVK